VGAMNVQKNKYLIYIVGPTAVGKTSTAIEIAHRLGADIFSADSRQVYREMSIGTAKPSLEDMHGIKHHFIDHVSIHDKYDVGTYESECTSLLKTYFKDRDIAILCGGTGLYINSIMYGLDEFPDVSVEVTKKVEQLYEIEGIEGLNRLLQSLDPEYYQKVDLKNSRRVVRALEVCLETKKPYSSFLANKSTQTKIYTEIPFCLHHETALLYQRINDRVDDMIDLGLEKEVEKLYDYKDLRPLATVGYQELFDYMDGVIPRNIAIDQIKTNSRRYAKRQKTWFRKYGDWKNIDQNFTESILSTLITHYNL
jgi:tRNA dimethylallyltransferase